MFGFIRALMAAPGVLDDLEKTKRQVRDLADDLTALWDRFQRLHGRLAARERLRKPEPEGEDSGLPVNGDRQTQLNEMILARRRGSGISR